MHPIKIIKHPNPIVPIQEHGDILKPFEGWETTTTGAGWYSKVPDEYYDNKPYYLLTTVCQNSWKALEKLEVNCADFKEMVKYTCPYNGYVHYWCVPVLIFTQEVKLWTVRYKTPKEEMLLDKEWMKKFFPIKTKRGLPFTKIQRALLGAGYTKTTGADDGMGYLYDALIALDNGDFLGGKIWIWFNKYK